MVPTNFLFGAVREIQPGPLGRTDAGLSPVGRTPKYGQSLYDEWMCNYCPFENTARIRKYVCYPHLRGDMMFCCPYLRPCARQVSQLSKRRRHGWPPPVVDTEDVMCGAHVMCRPRTLCAYRVSAHTYYMPCTMTSHLTTCHTYNMMISSLCKLI